ncbi:MAG TPA: alpha/beta hydrolase [Ktedonobacterales bacterium]
MSDAPLDFIHRFVPAHGAAKDAPTLLLLHGTGGDENDLLSLGPMLAPKAALLSPRGKVSEQGMARFFRRLAEGVFDENDIRKRSAELAAFVAQAATFYDFDPKRVVAVGFSNGAITAASLMLLHPDTLAGAILSHAMIPLVPETLPDLRGRPVLLTTGQSDMIVPASESERLAKLLERAGAEVTLDRQPGGHALTRAEIEMGAGWLRAHGW